MTEYNSIAQAILARRKRDSLLPPARLWRAVRKDVSALALEQHHETKLLIELYRLIFRVDLSP